MMWLLFAVLLVFASRADCGALRCAEGNCTPEEESKAPPIQLSRDELEPSLLPRDAECQAGSVWESNCHSCRCSEEGLAECVKQATCDKGSYAKPLRCKPNTTFEKDCNTCVCLPTGLGLCTLKACGKHGPVKRSAELPSGKDCAPGTTWMSQCNSCFCGPTGIAACTYRGCPSQETEPLIFCASGSMWRNGDKICQCNSAGRGECNEIQSPVYTEGGHVTPKRGIDHIERHSVCEPLAVFYISCNACRCNAFGTDYTCTNKPCPLPTDVEVFHELKIRSAVNTTKAIVCVANRMFIKDCNTCWCNEDGTSFYCTRRVCTVPDDGDQEDMLKETQTKLSRKVRAYQEPPKQCQPGEVFRLDCNKCLCDNEGQNFSCTRIDCNAVNKYPGGIDNIRAKRDTTAMETVPCVAGSVFMRGCNVCRCSLDGRHAACTLKACRDNELDARATEQDLGFRCNPGEQFAKECNDCTCSADGRSVFCTLRLCDKYISPDK